MSTVETSPQAALLDGLNRLAPRIASGGRAVVELRRLSGGASQELWSFVVEGKEEPVAAVLRRGAEGVRLAGVDSGVGAEAALLRLAAAHGVPVPEVLAVLTPEDGLGEGFVMAKVDGETLGGRIVKAPALADARPKLAAACGAILARLHAIPIAAAPALPVHTPETLLRTWEAAYVATGRARPVFALALRWLEQYLPPPREPALVHGDFRNGNLMVGPDGVRAVLDWELAHLGDPLEDLGWICAPSWRFGVLDKPVGGFGEREDLYAGYEAAGGARVDRDAMRWWEAFAVLRWGIMCAAMPAAFRDRDPSVERAVIARRASETEIDLMRLLDAA